MKHLNLFFCGSSFPMMKNLDFDQVQSRVVLTIQSGSVNPQLTGKDVVDGVRFSFVLRDFGDTLEKS